MSYDYLKSFVHSEFEEISRYENDFNSVSQQEIAVLENYLNKYLRISIPNQLREFYEKIGYGF